MKNNAASVLARLKNLAKKEGLSYNELLIRYGIERMLKRLEMSPYASKCILKGGTMFIIWDGGFSYRPTMDADIEYRGVGTPEELTKVFREVAAVAGCEDDALEVDGDSVRAEQIREGDEYGGVRVTMLAYIANVKVPIQFDVGIGDAVTPRAKVDEFPGGRAIVRTFRRTWKTRRAKARNKDGVPIRKLVGEPTRFSEKIKSEMTRKHMGI